MSDYHSIQKTAQNHVLKRDLRSIFIGLTGLLLLIGIDQGSKLLAERFLRFHGPVVLIPGVFELHYLQNHGAAFGMMQNMQWIFVLFALAITAAACYIYVRCPKQKRYLPIQILCVLLSAGALGNMIDRLSFHYVIDFLYFSLIDFPIFNVADIYVCISTAFLLYLLVFYYTEEDLQHIQGKKTKREYLRELIEKIQESKDIEK